MNEGMVGLLLGFILAALVFIPVSCGYGNYNAEINSLKIFKPCDTDTMQKIVIDGDTWICYDHKWHEQE